MKRRDTRGRFTVVAPLTRLLEKLNKRGPNDCWIWNGNMGPNGYGLFRWDRTTMIVAHRAAYLLLVGPIPQGFQIDHLCRNHSCCNPKHMEPVTPRTNVLRGDTLAAANLAKTHCPQGHPYDRENTKYYLNHRSCRICSTARTRRWKETTGYKTSSSATSKHSH